MEKPGIILNRRMVAVVLLLFAVAAVLIEATQPPTVQQFFPQSDKLVHFLVYGGIVWLCTEAVCGPVMTITWKKFFAIILFSIGVGVLAECIQSGVRGREVSGYDMLANLAGALVFLSVWKSRSAAIGTSRKVSHGEIPATVPDTEPDGQ